MRSWSLWKGLRPKVHRRYKGLAQAFAGEQGVPVQGAVSCGSKALASRVVFICARGRVVPPLGGGEVIQNSGAAVALQVQAHQRQQKLLPQPHQARQVAAAHAFAGEEAQRHHGANPHKGACLIPRPSCNELPMPRTRRSGSIGCPDS